MKYEHLDEKQQQQIIDNRLAAYESDHFNVTLNLELAESRPLEGMPGEVVAQRYIEIANLRATLADLERAITHHKGKKR